MILCTSTSKWTHRWSIFIDNKLLSILNRQYRPIQFAWKSTMSDRKKVSDKKKKMIIRGDCCTLYIVYLETSLASRECSTLMAQGRSMLGNRITENCNRVSSCLWSLIESWKRKYFFRPLLQVFCVVLVFIFESYCKWYLQNNNATASTTLWWV